MELTQIADYEVVRVLGEGEHGRCFLAVPPSRLAIDDEHVVVKTLHQTAANDGFRRVVDQLRFVASVRSPHLARMYDVGYQGGVIYYALEYCAGGSLAAPARPLERGTVVALLADAARGAHALHEAGTAHRDIKPSNVLIGGLVGDTEPAGRLADPGLVPLIVPGQTTTGGGRVSDVEYVEPGVLRGESAGRASDVWSLGVTIHRALAGETVYPALPTTDVVAAVRSVMTTPPSVAPSLEGPAADVVRACLATERADRPNTALEVAELLARVGEPVT